jgi:cyclic beta-1,2-glucan synthetase
MYRVGLEGILGLKKRGDTLFIEPRAPASWSGYTIEYRHGGSLYVIAVQNGDGATSEATEVTIDGRPSPDGGIRLVDDGERHEITIRRVTSEVQDTVSS